MVVVVYVGVVFAVDFVFIVIVFIHLVIFLVVSVESLVRGGSRLQKSELTPIDYLGLVQMAMTSPQIGLISPEVEKPPPYGARQN